MLLPIRLVCAPRDLLVPAASLARRGAAAVACLVLALACSAADAQAIVYQSYSPIMTYSAPMAAGYPGGYVANYSPAGNYAAVTAFSPPVTAGYVASYPVTQVAAYPVQPAVAMTSYYAPAPVVAAPIMAAPAVVAPVTTYYAPSAVVAPLYRRGPFGGLRPVRTAMYIPY
jgi:hypothetical protein